MLQGEHSTHLELCCLTGSAQKQHTFDMVRLGKSILGACIFHQESLLFNKKQSHRPK